MKVFSNNLGQSTIMMLGLLLSFILLSPSQFANAACTKTWKGTADSNWNNLNNWEPSGVPNQNEDVCIFPGANPDPIISTTPTNAIKSLTIPNGETLTINASQSLTVKGDFLNSGIFTANSDSTVILDGSSAQTIGGTSTTEFINLTINNASGVTLAANASVRTLTLTAGKLTLGSNILTIRASGSIAGSPFSATKMIDASGSGELRKQYNAAGSFVYPIGTGSVYSPMTINVTSGTFTGSPYVGVRVTDGNEPHLSANPTNYISRYWTTNSTFSSVSADVTLQYDNADAAGDEAKYKVGKYSSGWIFGTQTVATPASNTVKGSFTSLSSNFTAGDEAALAAQLASFNANFVNGHVLVEWGTVYELDNLGFNLYRSTSADSLGSQINDQLIESQAPGSGQGSLYEYQDSNIETGQTYFYTLEDIDTNGNVTRHGPVTVDTTTNPTAVTVEEITASSTTQNRALYLLLGSVFLAGAGMIAHRRQRR